MIVLKIKHVKLLCLRRIMQPALKRNSSDWLFLEFVLAAQSILLRRESFRCRNKAHLQLIADDLSADRLRELGFELDNSRVLVRSGALLDVLLNILLQLIRRHCSLDKNDACLDDLTADIVLDSGYAALEDVRKLHDNTLDLERSDAVAGGLDDVIKSSGYRIGPFEIESVLMELPYVLECAVTGVPDETRGHVVKATIVLTKGTTPSEQLVKDIQEYVKKGTAPYKYPRVVEFVEELPKTVGSGKIRRAAIREMDKAKYQK
jgi:acyl-CoA synthetase (AMP-forming)/AMP-acid ligase II